MLKVNAVERERERECKWKRSAFSWTDLFGWRISTEIAVFQLEESVCLVCVCVCVVELLKCRSTLLIQLLCAAGRMVRLTKSLERESFDRPSWWSALSKLLFLTLTIFDLVAQLQQVIKHPWVTSGSKAELELELPIKDVVQVRQKSSLSPVSPIDRPKSTIS